MKSQNLPRHHDRTSLRQTIHPYFWLGCLLLVLLPAPLLAEREGDFQFRIADGRAEVTAYTGPGGAVVIPEQLGGSDVVTIGAFAFRSNSAIAHITLPEGIYAIEDGAFQFCDALVDISLPESLQSIGEYAFYECASLRGVTIPSHVMWIGRAAFIGCHRLHSVVIPGSVSSINDSIFAWCSQLTDVTLSTGIQVVQRYAFVGCSNLSRILLPSTVTTIFGDTFLDCPQLTSIDVAPGNSALSSDDGVLISETTLLRYPPGRRGPSYDIPPGITSIAELAFADCYGLATVFIPDGLTLIDSGGFLGCTNLERIEIPRGVSRIGDRAFEGCARLREVKLPESLLVVEGETFEGCDSLESVTFSASGIFFGDSVFADCRRLVAVQFEGRPPITDEGNLDRFVKALSGSPHVTVFYWTTNSVWWPTYIGSIPTAPRIPRPVFSDWIVTTGLAARYPNASGVADDPDGDGLSNLAEWYCSTDPTVATSALAFELNPRVGDLDENDLLPVPNGYVPIFLKTEPGKYYGIEAAFNLDEGWELTAVRVASLTQTRFLIKADRSHAFFRARLLQ